MHLKNLRYGVVDWIQLAQNTVEKYILGTFEHDNEPSGSWPLDILSGALIDLLAEMYRFVIMRAGYC
jgi:hypothetical protein